MCRCVCMWGRFVWAAVCSVREARRVSTREARDAWNRMNAVPLSQLLIINMGSIPYRKHSLAACPIPTLRLQSAASSAVVHDDDWPMILLLLLFVFFSFSLAQCVLIFPAPEHCPRRDWSAIQCVTGQQIVSRRTIIFIGSLPPSLPQPERWITYVHLSASINNSAASLVAAKTKTNTKKRRGTSDAGEGGCVRPERQEQRWKLRPLPVIELEPQVSLLVAVVAAAASTAFACNPRGLNRISESSDARDFFSFLAMTFSFNPIRWILVHLHGPRNTRKRAPLPV